MDENPYDPCTLAHRHYRENLWLRIHLESVAQELERECQGPGRDEGSAGPSRGVRLRLLELKLASDEPECGNNAIPRGLRSLPAPW